MSISQSESPEFSKWRTYLWPVHSYELKKLIPMLVMFFLLMFDYNIVRTMKDTLVVTASGAEVIPFIKVWVMFPGALLLTYIFTRLSNRFSREKVFYIMVSLFLSYFFIFALVLYPARDFLHPNETADSLQAVLPLGFKGMIALFRNWTFTTFYVMSELWGTIILFVLFWGFANQVTRLQEAKRFYGLFGIGANFSGVIAGLVSAYLSNWVFNPNLPFGEDQWEQTMIMLLAIVLAGGLIAMVLFRWMNRTVLTDPRYYDEESVKKTDEEKPRLSMRDSFKYLFKSKYLLSIALIVICYNLVINLVEVVWKHQVRELYPNSNSFNLYMSQVTAVTGVLATLTALFVSGNSIRRLGWSFTALLTPAILLITSVGFFAFLFLKQYSPAHADSIFGIAPLAIVVFFGSAQNVLSRAAKYTVFDATKEMAFIPLSSECKLKGKAVIDGVCSRLGKSGGSLIHQSLLVTFSTLAASMPYVGGFLFVIISIWIVSTAALGRRFNDLTSQKATETDTQEKEIGLVAQQAV